MSRGKKLIHKNDTKQLYKIVKKLSGKSSTISASNVNKRNGKPPSTQKDLLTEWAEYFKNLLNNQSNINFDNIPAAEEDLEIRVDDFSLNEIQKAVNTLKFNKTPGIDYNITAETLRSG